WIRQKNSGKNFASFKGSGKPARTAAGSLCPSSCRKPGKCPFANGICGTVFPGRQLAENGRVRKGPRFSYCNKPSGKGEGRTFKSSEHKGSNRQRRYKSI